MNTLGKIRKTGALAIAVMLMAFAPAGDRWQVKQHAKANFTIDGMMGIDVDGTLAFKSASIAFDPDRPETGNMEAVLAVSSIATGIGKRDRHLKSDDYFESGKYPDITFRSTKIEGAGPRQFRLSGNLTIKAVTRPVVVPFTFSSSGNEGVFKGKFTINRVDFGIGNGREMGMGKEVRIRLDIPVKKS